MKGGEKRMWGTRERRYHGREADPCAQQLSINLQNRGCSLTGVSQGWMSRQPASSRKCHRVDDSRGWIVQIDGNVQATGGLEIQS